MMYNSNKHTADLTTADVLEMLDKCDTFNGFVLGGEGTRLLIDKGMYSNVSVDLWTRSGSLKVSKVQLVPQSDYYFNLQRENTYMGRLTLEGLGLEVPAGWCVLGDNGLIHTNESRIAELLRQKGFCPSDIGANLEEWLESHSTVEIHGVSYSALEVLQYLDEDRLEELEEECMTDYLENYGPNDIETEVEGVLWWWDDDNMTLSSGRFELCGQDYVPGFEPNYHKEWEA